MKLAALAPALFVLVSMCGSPVPAPPGSVSGTVYFDANHNAIHDKCDSGLGLVEVLATYADGTTTRTRTNGDGAFRIDDARPGDATVSFPASDGFAWPITTTPEGVAGVAVHVESNQESAGVEIGSASRSAFATSSVSIIGVIFNDTNENGVIDRDECGKRTPANLYGGAQYVSVGNRPFVGVSTNGTYEVRNLGTGQSDATLAVRYILGAFNQFPLPEPPDIAKDNPCFLHGTPQPRYSASLYEANIPYTLGKSTGSVTGYVFDDANGNGLRDEGEPGIAQQAVYLNPQGPTCGTNPDFYNSKPTNEVTDADGEFNLANVPLGIYTIQFGGTQYNEGAPPDPTTITTPGWRGDLTAKVLASKSTTVNLPLKVEQSSTISVFVFDDANGDGLRGDSEDPVDGYWICAHPPSDNQTNDNFVQYKQACGITGHDGVVLLRPLLSGQYVIPSDDGYRGIDTTTVPIRTPPTPQLIDLGEGEQVDVSLPLDVIQASEQVIAPGAGAPVNFETCFSDPEWVQPPFEDGFINDPNVYGSSGETYAREVYNRGIYLGSSGEIGIWAQIAGRPDWLATLRGCSTGYVGDYTNAVRLVVFVDYEPTSLVASGDVIQFTLVRRQGLYAALLPFNSPHNPETPDPTWFLFVDEASHPIYRANRYPGGGYGYVGGN